MRHSTCDQWRVPGVLHATKAGWSGNNAIICLFKCGSWADLVGNFLAVYYSTNSVAVGEGI